VDAIISYTLTTFFSATIKEMERTYNTVTGSAEMLLRYVCGPGVAW